MGGVYLSEGKNGGSILRCRKKWGEDTLAAEGRVYLHTPPPRGNFGSFPNTNKIGCLYVDHLANVTKIVAKVVIRERSNCCSRKASNNGSYYWYWYKGPNGCTN